MSKRLSANYRNQWPSLNNAFTSFNVSYDQYIDGIRGGFGVLVNTNRDVGGLLSTTSGYLIYSYRLQVSQNVNLNMGLGAGIYQRSIDWGSLIFEEPEEIEINSSSRLAPDFNFGFVLGYKDYFYGGAALHHLTQPTVSFFDNEIDHLNLKFTFHTGGNIHFGSHYYSDDPPKVTLSPAVVYVYQNISHQLNAGINFTVYPFVFGVWYRNAFKNPDAFIAMVGFYLRDFQFGYSYDATISKFSNATGGAHEVSLGYRFSPSKLSKRSIQKLKDIPCPRF
jgi:type IX secretion system PorP/SprF family membrane protein